MLNQFLKESGTHFLLGEQREFFFKSPRHKLYCLHLISSILVHFRYSTQIYNFILHGLITMNSNADETEFEEYKL